MMHRSTCAFSIAVVALAAAACGTSSTSSPGDSGTGGGDDGGSSGTSGSGGDGGVGGGDDAGFDAYVPPGNTLHLSGTVVDATSKTGIAGVLITAAGATTQSGDKGVFTIMVPPSTPFIAFATMTGYPKTLPQEVSLAVDGDIGRVSLIAIGTANLLKGILPGFDNTKGVIAAGAVPVLGCADEGGAQIAVSPAGGKLVYFLNGFPSNAATSVTAGQSPSAIAYNLDPATTYTLTVTSPTCQQVAYPYVDGNITYTGNVKVEAGDVLSEARVFLKK